MKLEQEELLKIGKSVIAPLAGSAVQIVADGLFVKIKNTYNAYGPVEQEEMRCIRNAYTYFCFPTEKDSALSTLYLDLDDPNKSNSSKAQFPIFFQMTEKDEHPILYHVGFEPKIEAEDWRYKIKKNSLLEREVREALNYIFNYQEKRSKKWTQTGKMHDPTNLFFEEFKIWLVGLSHVDITESNLKIVTQRIAYLRKIDVKNVFKNTNDETTRSETIDYIHQLLLKKVAFKMQLIISQKGMREYFNDLQAPLHNLIENAIQFLFYIGADKRPNKFMIGQIQVPQESDYKESINTRSGQLLNYILNTPITLDSGIFTLYLGNSPKNEITELSTTRVITDNFIVKYLLNQEQQTNIKEKKNILSFFSKSTKEKALTGLANFFCKEEKNIILFVKIHSSLSVLFLFDSICKKFQKLAGDFGNSLLRKDLLIYGFACLEKLESVIYQYKKFIRLFMSDIMEIYNIAEDHRKNNKNNDEKSHKKWIRYFDLADDAKMEMESKIKDINEIIINIQQKIVDVNSEEYTKQIQESLQELSDEVDIFTGKRKTLLPTSPLQVVNRSSSLEIKENEPRSRQEILYSISSFLNEDSRRDEHHQHIEN
jgi:hypothetical protein